MLEPSAIYERIPKDPAKNAAWRRRLYARCKRSPAFRKKVLAIAKNDILFFFAAFCYLQEPRIYDNQGRIRPSKIPFIPWPHQIPVILALRAALGREDVVVEKSRDEGMSWTAILMAIHDWLFVANTKIGLVSSTENLSDDPDNMDSLGAKVDWELEQMPEFLVGPRRERAQGYNHGYLRNASKHSWRNLRNRTTINAFAGGGDLGRGGRYLWFLLDELASKQWRRGDKDIDAMFSTSKATQSRFLLSTPSGPTGAYHDAVHEPSNVVRLQIRWSDNPTKNRGLYRMEHGVPVAIDPEYNPLPPEYDPPNAATLDVLNKLRQRGFVLEKALRSPWKDRECLRPKESPQSEARELDLDYGGAMDRIFGEDFRSTVIKTERECRIEGEFSVNDTLEKWAFDRQEGGSFKLWCNLDAQGKPPVSQYVVACDSATGEAVKFSSNSALIVADLNTREQVAEFTSKNIGGGKFADFAIGVCKWFHGAYLAWEHGGPGTAFTKRVLKREYHNHYKRKVQWRSSIGKQTQDSGWVTTEETKQLLLDELKLAVLYDELIVRSKPFRMECDLYVQDANSMRHAASRGADKTHADRVIAMGVLVQAMKDRPVTKAAAAGYVPWGDGPPPYGTAAHRQWEWEQEQRDKSDDWDDRSTFDLSQSRSHRTLTGV